MQPIPLQEQWRQERDPELDDVLREIDRLLDAGKELRGPSQDAHLAVIEAVAAPYAIAFVQEIHRLDDLLTKGLCGE